MAESLPLCSHLPPPPPPPLLRRLHPCPHHHRLLPHPPPHRRRHRRHHHRPLHHGAHHWWPYSCPCLYLVIQAWQGSQSVASARSCLLISVTYNQSMLSLRRAHEKKRDATRGRRTCSTYAAEGGCRGRRGHFGLSVSWSRDERLGWTLGVKLVESSSLKEKNTSRRATRDSTSWPSVEVYNLKMILSVFQSAGADHKFPKCSHDVQFDNLKLG
ncbi:hypothetical protein BJY52DRAFT_656274 [Lactarius psammicola]|nr:hypothetical protein BJY52DRAFT_656274 [Lactarius psammicola]